MKIKLQPSRWVGFIDLIIWAMVISSRSLSEVFIAYPLYSLTNYSRGLRRRESRRRLRPAPSFVALRQNQPLDPTAYVVYPQACLLPYAVLAAQHRDYPGLDILPLLISIDKDLSFNSYFSKLDNMQILDDKRIQITSSVNWMAALGTSETFAIISTNWGVTGWNR